MKAEVIRSRIERKIVVEDRGHTTACWVWNGARHSVTGYGIMRGPDRKTSRAHRIAYEAFVGPIPKGLVIDHLCRVRACVNPDHLEPVTNVENIRRGVVGCNHRDKTHCYRGHPFDQANTYVTPRGFRMCRACNLIATHAYRARKIAA